MASAAPSTMPGSRRIAPATASPACEASAKVRSVAGADRQTATAFLGALSRLYAQIATRAAPYWQMCRQGAATDAELRQDTEQFESWLRRTLTASRCA